MDKSNPTLREILLAFPLDTHITVWTKGGTEFGGEVTDRAGDDCLVLWHRHSKAYLYLAVDEIAAFRVPQA